MSRIGRILVVLAGLMGADGVILAALSSHAANAALLAPASSMLLFHASAVVGTVALVGAGLIRQRGGLAAALGFVASSMLFAADLMVRQFLGHALFPFAAPAGGTLLILSWIGLAVTAAFPQRA